MKDGSVAKCGTTRELIANPDFHLSDYGVRFKHEADRTGN